MAEMSGDCPLAARISPRCQGTVPWQLGFPLSHFFIFRQIDVITISDEIETHFCLSGNRPCDMKVLTFFENAWQFILFFLSLQSDN